MNEEVKRLLEDLRLLGPGGIQRVAEAWRVVAAGEDAIRTGAERRAEDDPEWREAENEIFKIARGEAWLSVPQTDRDSAAAAAQDALLGVLERKTLGEQRYRTLVGPMASALPWLLTGEREDRY
jgi:phage/plasmid-associated DNA primase